MAITPAPHGLRPIRPSWAHRHESAVLAGFVVLAELAGLAGALLASRSDTWYLALHRPAFDPPGWVFAPVWAVLYAALGAAAWCIWRHHHTWQRDVALRWWAVQLVLAAAWTPIFFGLQRPGWALADLSLAMIVAVVTAIRFLPLDRAATALLLPALAWLGFALAINIAIVSAN
jgi:benzodiazapine receptor